MTEMPPTLTIPCFHPYSPSSPPAAQGGKTCPMQLRHLTQTTDQSNGNTLMGNPKNSGHGKCTTSAIATVRQAKLGISCGVQFPVESS